MTDDDRPDIGIDIDLTVSVGPYTGSAFAAHHQVSDQHQAILLSLIDRAFAREIPHRVESFDGQGPNTSVRLLSGRNFSGDFFDTIAASQYLRVEGVTHSLQRWEPEGTSQEPDEEVEMRVSGQRLRREAMEEAETVVRVGFDW
jgi:hypothetical protein